MKFRLLICALLSCCTVIGQTTKPISEEQLKYYLSRSINVLQFHEFCKTPSYSYNGLTVVGQAEIYPNPTPGSPDYQRIQDIQNGKMFVRYQVLLDFVRRSGAKFITDACTSWTPYDWPIYLNRCRNVVNDIKNIDPTIIVQAGLNENANIFCVDQIGYIPDWVFVAFNLPVENRKFNVNLMTTQNLTNVEQFVPDIRLQETQLYFYYQARMFIDMGCECLTFSQVGLMNNPQSPTTDPNALANTDPTHWNKVFSKLRSYANTKANIRFLLITGHTRGMRDQNGVLAFDFNSSPIRPSELDAQLTPGKKFAEILYEGCPEYAPYGHSLSGITPSGWYTSEAPMEIFIDNYGNNPNYALWGLPQGGSCASYNYDEISWFTLQPELYKNDWLKYAFYKIKNISKNTYFSLPVKRDISIRNPANGWWPAHYIALNPDGNIFNTPALFANSYVDGANTGLYVGYGQENTIIDLLKGKYDVSFCNDNLVLQDYHYSNGTGWTVNHPRFLGDANGDGKDDIIGFGNAGVYVSYSTGTGFSAASLKISDFGYSFGSGWKLNENPRLIGDVNGDGKSDIVGFGNNGVILSLSTGTGFTSPVQVLSDYNYANGTGWTVNQPRFLADVNGDGKDDIVGFGNTGVFVSFSTGSGFTAASLKINNFGYNNGNGWKLNEHPRLIGDVNGDGKADIVGFDNNGVILSLSTGTTFTTPAQVLADYGYANGTGWTVNQPRLLADVDGDGKDDIVGFGNRGVYISYSTGTGFIKPILAIKNYGYEQGSGWLNQKHLRLLGDANGDGKADIFGFGYDNTMVSLSASASRESYNNIFIQEQSFPMFNYNNGWDPINEPRLLGDIDGDGKDEIVGFGNNGVYVENCGTSNVTFSSKVSPIEGVNSENLTIYPNPASSTLRLLSNHPFDKYAIFNIIGNIVKYGGYTNEINVSDLKPGIYIMKITTADGNITSRKITISR